MTPNHPGRANRIACRLAAALWLLFAAAAPPARGAAAGPATAAAERVSAAPASEYRLGPEDRLFIHILDLDEIDPARPVSVDAHGSINLPVAGRVQAAGLTADELESELRRRLSGILQEPEVTVTVSEFRSHPVSILGAVKNPGVHQVHGRKTLFEILSLAGGLNADAGNAIKITRRKTAGPMPLPSVDDPTGEFRVAEVSVRSVMEAKNPQENIEVLPHDVISVPKADLVYVIGAVRRSGGFTLSEKENISVLQALSLAEGLDRVASPKSARILRPVAGSEARREIPVDLKQILAGRSQDLPLRANDILFVPVSGAKSAALRGLEAAIQLGTGIAIYRR
ncbi:MAG: polysaccharide biosynthesis/export family protein [Acidobacteria bacterium]|nr:polysaccharide biosynthesis/export family protein [Acidobacteriota bacterium]